METNMEYRPARELLLEHAAPISRRERIPLEAALGKVLAEEVTAARDVPPFDRSPFDGYAFRAADTFGADEAREILGITRNCLRDGKTEAPSITAQ